MVKIKVIYIIFGTFPSVRNAPISNLTKCLEDLTIQPYLWAGEQRLHQRQHFQIFRKSSKRIFGPQNAQFSTENFLRTFSRTVDDHRVSRATADKFLEFNQIEYLGPEKPIWNRGKITQLQSPQAITHPISKNLKS